MEKGVVSLGPETRNAKAKLASVENTVPEPAVSAAVTELNREAKPGLLSFKKSENFGEWYSELVVRSELIDYYDISGCYILHPWSVSIWESIQAFLDKEIKKLGVENAYFPLFVSEKALNKEEDHVEGFSPEVAWVTKAGDSNLEIPIAIRPTSETVMYPYFSKRVRSHRDLPLKRNQWCNVVRWEFKHPTPFIRSREFLWQEGHTAFTMKEEADNEVYTILEIYRRVYEDLLAVPVIKGMKSEHEKFAGGLYTTSVEAFIPTTGRGVQAATSHSLGQNFAKMFDIQYEDEDQERKHVWQNSWGLTTRTIGVMVMIHSDDKGLVLPPRVAPIQIVVIPIPDKTHSDEIYTASTDVTAQLAEFGFRVREDARKGYTLRDKCSHWELKGVPLRVEIGKKENAAKQVSVVRRNDSEMARILVPREKLKERLTELLEEIQSSLLDKAKKERDDCIVEAFTWEQFIEALNNKKMVRAPWCDEVEVEKSVKDRTTNEGEGGAAKTLCIPLEQEEIPEGTVCFASGKPAKKWALWGRSY